jgi:hypothetical protein
VVKDLRGVDKLTTVFCYCSSSLLQAAAARAAVTMRATTSST